MHERTRLDEFLSVCWEEGAAAIVSVACHEHKDLKVRNNVVRRLRKAGWSVKEVSQRTGLSPSQQWKILNATKATNGAKHEQTNSNRNGHSNSHHARNSSNGVLAAIR